jgi:uncharacterized protein YxjI
MAVDNWTRYQLKEKLFSIGEDFWIENERGESVYRVDGKALTVRETFMLEDGNGAERANIHTKLLAFMPTMNIDRGDQTRNGEQPVATISRQWFSLHQSYGTAIAPGQDEILLLSAAVCIDEMSEDERKRHQQPPGLGNLPGFR